MRSAVTSVESKYRCRWAESDDLMRAYHDKEWGKPMRDSRMLWEMLCLEGFQAGLSWSVILKKRAGFRRAFHGFDPAKVAKMTKRDVDRLMKDEGIVRARAKIEAMIGNAKAYLALQQDQQDFSKLVWKMAGEKPIAGGKKRLTESPLSNELSKTFKKLGFKFVGPVIVYAWMQAVGIVNDHEPKCFCR
jgi:DNA-3-methyladenine glycosylase I